MRIGKYHTNEHIGNSYLFYIDHNMVFSLWLWPTTISTRQKMQANQRQCLWPWRCSGMTRGTLPDKAHPGLHSKPLDAAIGRSGQWSTNSNKTHKTLTKHNFKLAITEHFER